MESAAGHEANHRSSSANWHGMRSSFDGLASNKLEQTFSMSQEREGGGGYARDVNMSSASPREDFGAVMWGYSPNFMMKQQHRSRSQEGVVDHFSVENESNERENRKILSEKIKAL